MIILEHITGKITETAEATRNGIPVGKVSGLITTFVPSRPFDSRNLPKRFESTAFENTLQTHRERGDRPIRLLHEHTELIGGFPIEGVHTTSEGLFGTGEINLNTQLGRETFALAQQGVLTDLSMGYAVTKHHNEKSDLVADEIEIFEASITSEPANQGAKITSLENLSPRDLREALARTGLFSRAMCKELTHKALQIEQVAEVVDAEPMTKEELVARIHELTKNI
jgi:HK97 family phage prohead protease